MKIKKNFNKKYFDLSVKSMLQKHIRQLQKDLQAVQGKAWCLGKNTFYLSLGVLGSLRNPLSSFRNVLWKKDRIPKGKQV